MNSEAELVACFREIDRGDVQLAAGLTFPVKLDRVLTWSVGPRAYLVFRDRPNAAPRGIFHRSSEALPDVVAMCEWCHAVRGHGGVKLLTARSGDRRRVGLYLCSDLSCVSRAGEPPDPNDLPEALDRDERERRTLLRIGELAARRLF